eukprot:NODE_1178_length_1659_cov_97.677019_g1045_i0.p1 GENE.NODE_1178_length_1659_cov_97.677019_g1045_i0~~NODE_1178_length_1659_cov_97.677019_g1045_i0.p1  ORF type:complete len:527 (-),score=98.01 NODE_1178_length_1659_cov_97.677019_g1045_i0:77-1609(-)
MDLVEEVAYRNRPPLLEDVSIQGPLRIPIKDAMQTLEEREAIEADFRWYRWSKFAFPWLLWCLLLGATLFCLTAWQQVGSLKTFDAKTVNNDDYLWGVPRILVKKSETSSDDEGGMPKALRNIRIAAVFAGAVAVVAAFATFFGKPRPRIRSALNFLWAFLLIVTAVLAAIAFGVGINNVDDAVQCPWRFEVTFEKCTERKGTATIAIILDAAIFVGALTSAILLAWYTRTGDWKLFRTGWRERERDAEEELVQNAATIDKSLRKIRPVRITILSAALLFTLAAVIVLAVFIVILHQDYLHEYALQSYRGVDTRGKDLNERSGWPTKNTRLRYAVSSMTVLAILLNFLPFTHRALAYLFAVLYVIIIAMAYTNFGLDIHEVTNALDLKCPNSDEVNCRISPFVATLFIEFVLATSLFLYVMYEYVAKGFSVSRWSGRNYVPGELKKHDEKLDSMRPVRCELTGEVMTAKEYVYRYRFIAGTNPYYEQPDFFPGPPVPPMIPSLAAPPVVV